MLVTQFCLTFATPWGVAHQAPLFTGFLQQEYWSGRHFLLQGIFPTQESNPGLLLCRLTLYCLSHQGNLICSELQKNLSYIMTFIWVSQVALVAKNLPAMQEPQEMWVQSLGGEDPLEEGMATSTPVFVPGKPNGQKSLVGYSPWGHRESDTTKAILHARSTHDIYHICNTEPIFCKDTASPFKIHLLSAMIYISTLASPPMEYSKAPYAK